MKYYEHIKNGEIEVIAFYGYSFMKEEQKYYTRIDWNGLF